MNRLVLLLIGFSLAFVGLVACSQNQGPKDEQIKVEKVDGDPMVFVSEAKLNQEGLPVAIADSDAQWSVGIRGFDNAKENVESENEAEADLIPLLSFNKTSKNQVTLKTAGSKKLSLVFDEAHGQLKLRRLLVDDVDLAKVGQFRVLHYSALPDHSAFNLLVYLDSEDSQFLLSYSFVKYQEKSFLEWTDEAYSYFFGPGVKVRWPQDQVLTLVVCHVQPEGVHQMTEDAMDRWSEALKGRLSLKLERRDACPPFSDLNTLSLSYVDGWIELRGKSLMAGLTLATADFRAGQFIDSDIFIFKSEYEEAFELSESKLDLDDDTTYQDPQVYSHMGKTILHEIGHLIGLHHICDGTPSVMSCNDDMKRQLYPYDLEAVQSLYPKQAGR